MPHALISSYFILGSLTLDVVNFLKINKNLGITYGKQKIKGLNWVWGVGLGRNVMLQIAY